MQVQHAETAQALDEEMQKCCKIFCYSSCVMVVVFLVPWLVNFSNSFDNYNYYDYGSGFVPCVKNRVSEGFSYLGGVRAMAIGQADSVILMLADVNGIEPNLINNANYFYQQGYVVIMPDYFNGTNNGNSSSAPNTFFLISLVNLVIKNLRERGYHSIQLQAYGYGGIIGMAFVGYNEGWKSIITDPRPIDSSTNFSRSGVFLQLSGASFVSLPRQFTFPPQYRVYPNTDYGFALFGESISNYNAEQKMVAMNDSLNYFTPSKVCTIYMGTAPVASPMWILLVIAILIALET